MPDPARSVEIDFRIRYVECDLAEERFENHPILQAFLSRHFVRSRKDGGIITIPLDEHHLNKVYSGTLKGELSRDYDGIPLMSAIGLDSYAIHREDHGHPCYVNVGTSHAYMGRIVKEVQETGAYDHTHDLLMRTTIIGGGEQIKKGTIELAVTNVRLGHAVKPFESIQSPLEGAIENVENDLMAYIQKSMQYESQLPELLDRTERIRAPMDISQAGIECTGGAFLPVAAFSMIEVPEANVHFFRNGLEQVLKRRNLELHHFKSFDNHEKCRTMAQLISYGVQSFDYIGDSVEKTNRHEQFRQRVQQGTEEFSNIWTSLAGDCEDSALGIYTAYKALLKTKFDQQKDPELLELQSIAGNYIPLLTLAVVHGQKIGDQEGRGAHMYLPLLPRHQFLEAMSRTRDGRNFLKRLRPAETPAGGVPLMRRVGSDTAAAAAPPHSTVRRDWPPMSAEGTGHTDPIGRKDPLLAQRKYIGTKFPAIRALGKMEIPREEGAPSNFYLAIMTGNTAEFIDQGIPCGTFIYGTVNNNNAEGGCADMVRGTLFTDMMNDHENMAMMPYPMMPKSTMRIIKEANALRPPPRPLILDPAEPLVCGPEKHPLLERFVEAVDSFGRRGGGGAGSVDVFIRPAHLDESLINAAIDEAGQASKLYAASYTRELVTNSICVYRLQLFVN